MYYVYILECGDGTLYTGYTNDVAKRVAKHNLGVGAKYTRGRTPCRLVYVEEFNSKNDAMRREWNIKNKLSRDDKLKLIHEYKCII